MVAEVARISVRQLLTTAAHASHAHQRLALRVHAGKTAHLVVSTTAMHDLLATLAIHAMLAQQPVATSVATGAQLLLLVVASLTTVHLATLAIVEHLAPSIVQSAHHDQLAMASVVGKTARHAPLTVTHAQRATTAHLVVSKIDQRALSIAMHAPHVHSIVTHVRLATTVVHAMSARLASSKTAQRAPLIAQSVRHASLTTAHASSTATTATTAPTAAQIVPTVLTVTAIATALSTELARATQTRRPSLKTRSLSV
jgi:hypothetical protein